MERLEESLRNSAIGISKEDAMEAVSYAYRKFVKENPKLYKSIMKAPKLDAIEAKYDIKSVFVIMHKILEPYKYSMEDEMHIIRGFRSIVTVFFPLRMTTF